MFSAVVISHIGHRFSNWAILGVALKKVFSRPVTNSVGIVSLSPASSLGVLPWHHPGLYCTENMAIFSVQSACPDGKTNSVSDYISEHDFDIVFITEDGE